MQETNVNRDQLQLLRQLLMGNDQLQGENLIYSAWASAYATCNEKVLSLVKMTLGDLKEADKQSIQLAVHRMGVTNPYFIARQYVEVEAGGSLDSIGFRALSEIGVENNPSYHYACIAVSVINGGFMCLRSHVGSLQSIGEPDEKIDAAMRLASVCHSLRAASFMQDN